VRWRYGLKPESLFKFAHDLLAALEVPRIGNDAPIGADPARYKVNMLMLAVPMPDS
jgi:hypothetical protein